MRELLASYRITQIAIKPVQREYAFESPAVRSGKQWVLKVRAHIERAAEGREPVCHR